MKKEDASRFTTGVAAMQEGADSLFLFEKIYRLRWLAICTTIFVAIVFGDLSQYFRERAEIRKIVANLETQDLSAQDIARRVQETIRKRVKSVSEGRFYNKRNRPKLRHTAVETWTYCEGRCGEGARLATNLLQAAGVPASRINLSSSSRGKYHTAVAYFQDEEWWLLDTINSPEEFHQWSRNNKLPISSLFAISVDYGGALKVRPNNPYFDRYSYTPWTRIFGSSLEVNQFVPFPQFVIHILENPPLLRFLAKLLATLLLALCGLCILILVKRLPLAPLSRNGA